MAAATRTKSPRKRKARRKRRRRRRPVDRTRLWTLGVIVGIVVFGIVATIAFDDAGDIAYERGNYKYAARMYGEALQIARELEDAQLVNTSLQALSHANAAQGRSR